MAHPNIVSKSDVKFLIDINIVHKIFRYDRIEIPKLVSNLEGKIICVIDSDVKMAFISRMLNKPLSYQEFDAIFNFVSKIDYKIYLKRIYEHKELLLFFKDIADECYQFGTCLNTSELKKLFIVELKHFFENGLTQLSADKLIILLNILDDTFAQYPKAKKLNRDKTRDANPTEGFELMITIDDENFINFHNSLNGKFLSATLPIFKSAFYGKDNYKQIVWLKKQNQLNYLIDNLIQNKVIKSYSAWKHSSKMFILENGPLVYTNFRSNRYKGKLDELDKAVQNLVSGKTKKG